MDNFVQGLSLKVHVLENLLKDAVNDVTQNESVVYVTAHTLKLMLKEGTSCAWKGLNNLGCREKDIRFNNNHRSFVRSAFSFVVIKSELESVFFGEGANDSDQIALFCPDLMTPLSDYSEFEH